MVGPRLIPSQQGERYQSSNDHMVQSPRIESLCFFFLIRLQYHLGLFEADCLCTLYPLQPLTAL